MNQFNNFLVQVTEPIRIIRIGILFLVTFLAVGFAIWVGIKLAKAEDEGKRKEAKQQLLWALVAAIGAVLMLVIFEFALQGYRTFNNDSFGGDGPLADEIGKLIALITTAFTTLLDIAGIIAILFAIYIASKLALAQDEGKRKEAKKQLLWTLIAVAAVFVLAATIQSVVGAMAGMGEI